MRAKIKQKSSLLWGSKRANRFWTSCLLFLVAFNITKDVRDSAYAALALSLLLTLVRLVKRETIQHAVSGVIGVGICAWLSMRTGKAEDFYLPGLWTNAIYGSAYFSFNTSALASNWTHYWSTSGRKL